MLFIFVYMMSFRRYKKTAGGQISWWEYLLGSIWSGKVFHGSKIFKWCVDIWVGNIWVGKCTQRNGLLYLRYLNEVWIVIILFRFRWHEMEFRLVPTGVGNILVGRVEGRKCPNGKWALSQLRICRPPPPLKSGQIFMKDAECAE